MIKTIIPSLIAYFFYVFEINLFGINKSNLNNKILESIRAGIYSLSLLFLIEFYENEFKSKCKNEGLDASQFSKKLDQRLAQYKGRWQKSMKEQIHDLPEFDQVERELQRHFRKLNL